MAIGPDARGPFVRLILPDGRVVVQVVGQVVGHQVFTGDPEVHGVPVLKLGL